MIRIPKEYEKDVDDYLSSQFNKEYDLDNSILNRMLAYGQMKEDVGDLLNKNKKFVVLFPTDQDSLICSRSPRKEELLIKLSVSNNSFVIGPGLYMVIGAAGFGKSTLIQNFKSQSIQLRPDCFIFGESHQGLDSDWFEIQMTASALDLAYLSMILSEPSNSLMFIDSLTFMLSYNQGAGIESGGLPSRPFQTFKALNQALERMNRIMLAALVVRPAKEEHTMDLCKAYFNRLKGDCNGVFFPNISRRRLEYSIRYERIANQRITVATDWDPYGDTNAASSMGF